MKLSNKELAARLQAAEQTAHLYRMALRWMLEQADKGEELVPIYQTYCDHGLPYEFVTAANGVEHYAFYAFELDRPHGGMVLISHTVFQRKDQPALITETVHYLDELWHTTQKDPGGSWYTLAAPALERARELRDAA